ncbi:unnamed protein product [Symbiodinium sp. CCMP2592]|nr:unnamed protein product [Symbiodinium sp. CCMP2592]CAE7352577.1 unnamed protein product [Symbiodinium sp. CCMP2592]
MEHVWEPGPAKFTAMFNHDKSVADFLKFSPQKLLCQPFMSATASSPQAQIQRRKKWLRASDIQKSWSLSQLMVQWDFAERRWWDIRESCATEANKRELLVNHGWTGYQAQKKEEWVVWWYLSDTIWAWESDLFGAEEARLGEREWPVESAEHVFVPGQRTVSGQLAAVRAQRPGTRECQQRKKESKCL